MEALQKENNLLKGYVSTLEKENEARNVQKTTLYNQVDRLSAEVDRLTSLLSNSRVKQQQINKTTISNAEKQELVKLRTSNTTLTIQIQNLKNQNQQLSSQIQILKVEKRNIEARNNSSQQVSILKVNITNLTESNREKDVRISSLTQQNQNYIKELKTIKEQLNQSSLRLNQMVSLENQLSILKGKSTQVQLFQQDMKNSSYKVNELENTIRRIEGDLRKAQSDYRQAQNEIKRLESENRDLKSSNKSPSQISNLLSNKLTLEASIRQLTGKIEWAQSNNKSLQNEKIQNERRIRNLEKQLLESKGKLTQLRFNQDSYKKVEANILIKQKQMDALQHMISSLKDNIKYLQKALKEKEDIITSLESQVYTFRTSNFQFQNANKQLREFKLRKQEDERQKNNLISAIQRLQLENSKLKQQNQTIKVQIVEVRGERERLIQEMNTNANKEILDRHSHLMASNLEKNKKDDDLRRVVEKLQQQVQEIKQISSQITNQSNINVDQFGSNMYYNQKSAILLKEKSPIKVGHSKLIVGNEKERHIAGRQKWQNLQKKINVLRNENDLLKRSLFQ